MITDDNMVKAHEFSRRHRELINVSHRCGCFYCGNIFAAAEIREWIDEIRPDETAVTGLCPKCGIDSVLPDSAGLLQAFWNACAGTGSKPES
jgi:hypothetical protein